MKLVAQRVPDQAPPPPSDQEDPFAAFTSETASGPKAEVRPRLRPVLHWPHIGRRGRRAIIAGVSLVAIGAAGILGVREVRSRWPATPLTGRLTATSTPAGATVWVDGVRRGVTPLTMELEAGNHKVSFRNGPTLREVAITSRPNVEIVQAIDLAAPAPTTGSLSVASEPPGMRLAIDGTAHGTTPAVVGELPPGSHHVTLTGKNGSADRSVTIQAGSTATLMVTMPAESATAGVGSVTITSAIDVQLFEGETLVGSSRSARLFLPAGSHTITAVNDVLGYRHAIQVDVKPNATSRITVPVPNGALSVNAQPWAEVFIDGQSVGETPIGNYALPIGSHDLVLKHPQLGERRQAVVIGVGRTARVGVDLRK